MAEPNLIPLIGGAALSSCAAAAALFAAFLWPRRRVTDRCELFVAAPPNSVWDTYFVHINKADYRPGTRPLAAEIVSQAPLTVRVTVQSDLLSEPQTTTLVYDVWQPYERYRLHDESGNLAEEGTFGAEPGGGTRLNVAVTAERVRGFVLPWIVRRRTRRNQQALKDLCEGRPLPPRPRAPPRAGWEALLLLVLLAALNLDLPAPLQVVLAIAGVALGVVCVRRLLAFARRL